MGAQMQLEVILAGNRLANRFLKGRDNLRVNKEKTESGNCFCVVQSI